MLPLVLSLVAAVTASSNYSFPNGFQPDQVELATRCTSPATPQGTGISNPNGDQRRGVRPSVVRAPRSAVEMPMKTPASRYVDILTVDRERERLTVNTRMA